VVWGHHRTGLRTGFALIAAGSLTFNTFFIYLPNHLAATTSRSLPAVFLASVVGLIAAALAALGLGTLSDRVGRRPVVIGSVAAVLVLGVPLSLVAQTGSLVAFAAVEVAVGIAVGGTLSVSMLAEMFPTAVRATGLSLTAGLASAVVGGTAPLLDQILFTSTGVEVAPAVYCSAVAALALAAVSSWHETAFAALD
jgi:MFS transporter, MHS family, proline/betaine transporter